MTAYWSACDGCTLCTVCGGVAYCDGEPRLGGALCDFHTPQAAA